MQVTANFVLQLLSFHYQFLTGFTEKMLLVTVYLCVYVYSNAANDCFILLLMLHPSYYIVYYIRLLRAVACVRACLQTTKRKQ